MDKIVITGMSGFVGTNLKIYLKKDYQITGVSTQNRKESVTYEKLNNQLLSNSKAIVHLAGKAHDLKGVSNDKEYYNINTNLTKEVFDKFLKSDCNIFVFMSSVKAVADKVNGILKEDVVPEPITAYGKSKLKAEQYILSKKIPDDKHIFILRPCMIHGVNNKGNLNLLYQFISKGIPYPLGRYKNERSFLSVENLCFVIHEMIKGNVSSGLYNIADDGYVSTNTLVSIISNTLNKKAKILSINETIIKTIAKIGDLLKLPITTERLEKMTENYRVSNLKIKEAMNKPFPITAEQGLRKTLNSFK